MKYRCTFRWWNFWCLSTWSLTKVWISLSTSRAPPREILIPSTSGCWTRPGWLTGSVTWIPLSPGSRTGREERTKHSPVHPSYLCSELLGQCLGSMNRAQNTCQKWSPCLWAQFLAKIYHLFLQSSLVHFWRHASLQYSLFLFAF